MMEEREQNSSNSTQYIKSNNRGNTFDNTQRTTKEEDALNPSYTNPPLDNKEGQDKLAAGEKKKSQE